MGNTNGESDGSGATRLTIAASDFQELGLPDLSLPEAQPFYAPLVAGHDLIVVDNISALPEPQGERGR